MVLITVVSLLWCRCCGAVVLMYQIGAEKYRAPEVLFNPALVGLEYVGIHQCLVNAISKYGTAQSTQRRVSSGGTDRMMCGAVRWCGDVM